MAAPPTDTERDLQRLEAALKQLEAEYNMFFAGQLPRPPWQTRSRVDALVKQYDRVFIRNTGDRFRFEMLQSRYTAFIDLWDRGLRAREEGRAGPFPQKRSDKPPEPPRPADRVVKMAAFHDPMKEMDKLHDLYNSLVEARREVGEAAVPFHKFTDIVKSQVKKLKDSGKGEVAFRVAVKDGKVSFTARGMKGDTE